MVIKLLPAWSDISNSLIFHIFHCKILCHDIYQEFLKHSDNISM